jgi:large subunit ribosomal protein L25
MVPAIIYGHGKDPEPIAMPAHDVALELAHGAQLLNVELDGQQRQYLIKEVQYDHLGKGMLHVDLARVELHERVEVTVPLEFRGTPKGASAGAHLDHILVDLEVECLVTSIPQQIKVRVGELDVGESIYARDVVLPEGVKLVTDPDAAICTVRAKVAAAAPEEVEEAKPAAGEPEVIARGKEEAEGTEATAES